MLGTGWVLGVDNDNGTLAVIIATAYHVISGAISLQQTIKIIHSQSGQSKVLHYNERLSAFDINNDLAILAFDCSDLSALPKAKLNFSTTSFSTTSSPFEKGTEVGWMGYPGNGLELVSFFQGYISAHLSALYLIDGNIINGVSGSPVFLESNKDKDPVVIGVILGVTTNNANELGAPLARVANIGQYLNLVTRLKSEAQLKQSLEQ